MLSITAANTHQIQGIQKVSKKYQPPVVAVQKTLEETSPFLTVDPGLANRENFKHVLKTFVDEPDEDNGLTLLACNLRCRLAGVVTPEEAESTKKFVMETREKTKEKMATAQAAMKKVVAEMAPGLATIGITLVASDGEPVAKKPPTAGRYNPATILKLLKADHKVRPGSGAEDDLNVFRSLDGKTLGEIIPKLKSGGSAVGYWRKRGVIDLEG